MPIERDDSAERQARVDRMIDEFRKAQSRRLAKATTVQRGDERVESQRDALAQAAVARSTTSPGSH